MGAVGRLSARLRVDAAAHPRLADCSSIALNSALRWGTLHLGFPKYYMRITSDARATSKWYPFKKINAGVVPFP